MDGELPPSHSGPPANPGPAVKKKQPSRNRRRKSNSANKNENTFFKWWHPSKGKSFKWWHKALMDFMVKYPEHHAKLERQLRELANIVIDGDHLVVKAKSSQVDSAWRSECEEKLQTFFHDHTAQNVHVRNFHPAMLDDSKTHVAQLWPSNGCIVVAVAGLAKDVAQKIHTLKRRDKPRPYQQTSPSKIVVDNINIQKIHCQRLSDSTMQRIAANCQVSMVWISPYQLQISGIRDAVVKARQMVTDEIFRTKVKKISCQEWLFDQLLQERNEALRYFPELQIRNENGELNIMGHPNEVNTVYEKLHKTIDVYNELKITVPKKYHGYIIGTKGQKIVELQKNHQVFIFVPNRASDDDVVLVRGKKASTASAKIEIEALIAGMMESNKRSTVHLQISESHRHRLSDGIIRKVQKKTSTNITWKNPQEIILTGQPDKLEVAKALLLQETEASETKSLVVPNWLLPHLTPYKFDGKRKWPEVLVESTVDGISLSGHPTEVEPFFKELSEKLQELQESLVCDTVSVQPEYHRNIIGKGGQKIKDLKKKHKVDIRVPRNDSGDTNVMISGEKDHVEVAKKEIIALVKNLENTATATITVPQSMAKYNKRCIDVVCSRFSDIKIENARTQITFIGDAETAKGASVLFQEHMEQLKNSTKTVSIPMSYSQLLGVAGYKHSNLRVLRTEFPSAIINYNANPPTVTIEGDTTEVEKAHIHIVKMLPTLVDFCISEVHVPSELIGKMIGRGGSTLKSLQSRYPGVTRVETPNKNQRSEDNVIVTGSRRHVDNFCTHLVHRFNGELIRCQTKIENRHQRGVRGSLDASRRQSYGSNASLQSIGSSVYDDDFDNSAGTDNMGITKAAFYSQEVDAHFYNFVRASPKHFEGLKKAVGEETSLTLSENEICIAGEALSGIPNLWVQGCRARLDDYLGRFLFFKTTFHPLSSVERSDCFNEDLLIKWNENNKDVTVYGIKEKVEEKRAEFQQIKQKTRAVSYSWPCDQDFFIKFLKESIAQRQELEMSLKELGRITINDDNIRITADILESEPSEEWTADCQKMFDEFLSNFACEEILVSILLAGEMRVYCESQPKIIICWVHQRSSLVVYGMRSEVNPKTDFLRQKLEEIENRKKKVSVKWRCQNQDIFTFVKESTKQMEQFVKFLGEIGSPVLDDGFVTVHSEILAILPTENWEASCQSKISEFFDQFYIRIIEISESQEKFALTQIENRSSVTTKWIQVRNCLQICGEKAAVNLKVDLITKKLKQSENQPQSADFASTTTEDINANQNIPEETDEFGQTTIPIQLTETKIKCVLASATTHELCNVTIERQPDGVKISGKRDYTLNARKFIESIIADELEVKKYGAYEFLTDSTNGMQMEHIGIKHNCSIFVEQIIDSEWGEQKFISLPLETKKENLFGELSVSVEEGDITEDGADMIVNTSDKSFSFNGPLSRAIFSKAGEYLKVMFHHNKIDSEMGITVGGKLKCQKIVHVAIPASHESMEALIAKILTKANEHGMESITLPTIGAGGGGWSSQDVAVEMKNGIIKFNKENHAVTSLKRVKVMLFPSVQSSDKKPFYDQLTNAFESSTESSGAASKNQNDQSLLYKFISFFRRQPEPAPEPDKPVNSPTKDSTPDDEPQGESHTKKTEHGEFARIIISSTSAKCVTDAKEEIEKFVGRHLKEFSFDSTAILRLKHSHIEKMREIAEEQKVRITVNREKKVHTIKIQGPDEYTSQARDEVQKIISAISTDLPETWCEMPDGKKLLRVTLKPNSEEYNKVERRFTEANKSWDQYTVVKIERVQNPTLYRQYQSKKAEIAARGSTSAKVDRKLFHGTDGDTIDKICNDVFNRSYAGRNATAYGKGVYFHTESSYSNSYASRNSDGTRQMFLARVLTGDYCPGNPSMVDAPNNPKTGELYDSVVNSTYNPTIFVVFRDWSVYPSYIITYKS